MTIRAKIVTQNNIDSIASLNGGVRPARENLNNPTFFIYSEDDETFHNELLTRDQFNVKYRWADAESVENIIVEK